jgi:diacylglycerol O-acyltransferase
MDRLSTLDAEFLHLEDGVTHMHIAGACVFADPPPSEEELRGLIASKLHLIPRYRQRIRTVPFELGRPVWVDDPDFELAYHVRHTALPAPGDDATFDRLMGRLMSQPLDRGRPLWEAWLVEGLAGGHWAMVFKVHHCMVDGIAGVELLTVLLDLEPHTTVGKPEPWTPEPEPPDAAKVIDAWAGLAGDALRAVRGVPAALLRPADAARSGIDTARGLVGFGNRLTATPQLSIEGSIGPHRSWAHSSAALADVKTIRNVFGGTVNDVVLTAVAGGLRSLLLARGEDPTGAQIRSLVPVSARHDDGRGVPDNRVTALLYQLPVQLTDPVERLRLVHAQMDELKASHMDTAGVTVVTLGDLAPPMVVGQLSRLAMRAMRQLPQRSINTVTTNVPGPQFPLYCLGREMLEYRPYVPISQGLRVGTAILSYNGRLFFGVTGDYATTPDVAVVAAAITEEIDELRRRALTEPPP